MAMEGKEMTDIEKKAEEWVEHNTSWVSDGLWLAEASDCKRSYVAGYKAALEWARNGLTIAMKAKDAGELYDNIGEMFSQIEKELGK